MKKFTLIGSCLLFLITIFVSCVQDTERPKEPQNLDPYHISVERAIATMNATIAELYGSSTRASRSYTIETLKGSVLQNSATRSDTLPPLPEEVLYIVNFANDEGYAVLAADTRFDPVIAITEKGKLTLSDFEPTDSLSYSEPSNIVGGLLRDYVLGAIRWETDNPQDDDSLRNHDGGGGYMGDGDTIEVVNFVEPLVTTRWNQNYPYNAMCKSVTSTGYYYDYRAAAGCIAVAIAQVMAYHEKPALNSRQWIKQGSYSNWDGIYTERIDTTWSAIKSYSFNKPLFDYNNMYYYPNSHTDTVMYSNIACLIRSIGNSVNMRYGDSSWTLPTNIDDYFRSIGYRDACYHNGFKNNISTVIRELDNKRPIIITAFEPLTEVGAHTWVIDRYRFMSHLIEVNRDINKPPSLIDSGPLYMFHCNFGWGGDSDGYYLDNVFSSLSRNKEYDFENGNDMSFNYTWLFSIVTIKP